MRVWQTDHGLPQDSVHAIVQTRDGYLWLGTREGLARFDGMRFVTIELPFGEMKCSVSALCESADGSLWIGTEEKGVAILKQGKFSSLSQTNGLAGDVVKALLAARDGSIWIGTTNGLSRFQAGKLQNLSANDGVHSKVIRSIYQDPQGTIWFATLNGLIRLQDGAFTTFTPEQGLLEYSIRAICKDRQGVLWIGSDAGFTQMKNGLLSCPPDTNGLVQGWVNALYEDRAGTLWVGTYGGLRCVIDGQTVSDLAGNGPFDGLTYAFCEDHEGNIWVGSKDGLTRFSPRRCFSYSKQHGFLHNTVLSVHSSRDGTLWAGTWGGGLHVLKDGTFSLVESDIAAFNRFTLALAESRDGSMWFSSDFDSGLFRWNKGQIDCYSRRENIKALAIHEDSQTNLWIGTPSGLHVWKDGKFTRNTITEGLAQNTVTCILEDHAGNLWFGTDGGLSRLSNGNFSNLTIKNGLSHNSIASLYQDKDHTLWIGTRGGGLNRWQNGKFVSYTTREGLFHDTVCAILEDDARRFWISCPNGIFSISQAELDDVTGGRTRRLNCISYGKLDGLLSVECTGVVNPAGCRDQDGRLWFATSKGLVTIDPNVKIKEKPPVWIEEVSVGGKQLDLQNKIKVVAGERPFIFRYTALSLFAPEKVHFKYQLLGMDKDWVHTDSREASYGNLPPGDFTFRVIAANGDGMWNETGASLSLHVITPFWRQWWFVGLMTLTGSGMVGGAVRYVTRKKMQRKLERLQQQHAVEKERTRIAQDMHDELGARLTEILLLNDRAQTAETKAAQKEAQSAISEVTRAIGQNLNALVWAVSPRNDSLEKTVMYLWHYVDQFFAKTSIQCRFDAPNSWPAVSISSESRHNLFLIVKEATNNIVKYSEATEVWFRLRIDSSTLSISIEDNGKGFCIADSSSLGNGLQNMEKRMKSIGGNCCIVSNPGKGTHIGLYISIAHNG